MNLKRIKLVGGPCHGEIVGGPKFVGTVGVIVPKQSRYGMKFHYYKYDRPPADLSPNTATYQQRGDTASKQELAIKASGRDSVRS